MCTANGAEMCWPLSATIAPRAVPLLAWLASLCGSTPAPTTTTATTMRPAWSDRFHLKPTT
ncbi:hypothetical protein H257_12317 [Aphanomyces astaci]|uniref:Uncharacterized protein n=1 Tax=Aphanomyces astaci TaxID=112090 RepID=W4FZX9_APHAT|nr:hypothetical protein H257_12317 [Aphanomyces astaci]ETV72551.1 hypothetical protein H257_12317 [Aphanomyces astaci]|eukprot:XP_009837779.1 hypothetical protein H257_12317 [Aphanomyces astaci]